MAKAAQAQPACPLPVTQPPLCQQLTPSPCVAGTAGAECLPRKIRFNPAVPGLLEAVDCACATLGDECGPIFIEGDALRCPGVCQPPFPPNSQCQVVVNGMPTGQNAVIYSIYAPGTEFECACMAGSTDGACCLEDGTCIVGPATQCQGTYLGDGTTCSGAGACCIDADGDGIPETCQVVDQSCCELLYAGSFKGVGSACAGDVACCFSNGTCVVMDEICCASAGGSLALAGACLGDNNGNMIDDGCEDIQPMCQPTADGFACQQSNCPVAGQVCLPRCLIRHPDGTTVVEICECVSPNECHLEFDPASGAFQCVGSCPPGFTCQTTITTLANGDRRICCDCVQIPPPEGACCLPDGTCVVVPATQCQGVYLGDGTACGGSGACCFDADGDGTPETCQVMDQVCCERQSSSSFHGVGSNCVGDFACCLPNGSCVVIDEICCIAAGGSLPPGGVCLGDANGNNIDDACEDVPPNCQPTSDGTGCQPTVCPNPGEECLPRCIRRYTDGTVKVDVCECMSPNECHLEFDPTTGAFTCVGACPPGFVCRTTTTVDPLDGSTIICCECVQDVTGACCLEDGTCVVVPPNQCQGVYAGDGTACGGSGACCYDSDGDSFPDACSVVDEICCEISLGGSFQGVNTICAGKGACCFDIPGAAPGQCVVIDRICCDDIGGTFHGIGSICLGDANGDGSDDLCVPFDCGPTPDRLSCLPTVCPNDGEECLPRCILVRDDGVIEVIDCECRSPNECHLEWTPGTDPVCVGACPDGYRCETQTIVTPIGRQICCDCVQDPPECVPTDDGSACVPHMCPNPNEQCLPRCVRIGPNGQVTVVDCDCRSEDECHVADIVPGELPACIGNCPPGQVCVENLVINADGTMELCCDCADVECDCPGDMNGDGIRNGLDIGGFVRCYLGNPLAVDNCACADVDQDGDVDIDDVSTLVALILTKTPCPKEEMCPPEDLVLDISTGVDVNGNVIPIGSPDDQWTVISEPAPTGTLPRPATVIPANSAWLTIPGTQWISSNATGPNGTYVYELCFCLNNRFSNPILDLAIRADDEFDLILNGNFLGTYPGCFNCPNPLGISFINPNLFRQGENCLQVVVRNLGGVVTGFNLQGTVRARDGKCCCDLEDLDRDIASGVDDAGNLIASGASDDTWTITVDPSGGSVPRPATVINPNPAWLTIPGTKWIAASYTGPNGAYTYEHCFCLSKWFEDAQISLDLRADDRAEVYLNGNLVGMTPPIYAFNTPVPTHVAVNNQALFRVGENCIEVIVYNTHGVVTGVNIAGRITSRNGLCCDDRLECGPTPDGTACQPAPCPDAGQTCVPVCINVNADGVATVIDCDCRGPDECHAVFTGSAPPICEGNCPDGQECVQRIVQRADGSIDYCCECVDTPITGACCFSVGGCVILSQAECEAQGGAYLGNFTSCLGIQACCLQNGACIDTDAICCEFIYGGIPQGPGSVCLGDSNGDGRDDLCYPPNCGPVPGTKRCRPVQCPNPGEKCKPRCVRVEAGTTYVIEVLDCECMGPNECHVEIDPLTNSYYCAGGCPDINSFCRTTVTDLGDGTQKVCCECAEVPEPFSCCNYESGQCLDLAPGVTQCPVGYSLVPGPCGNLQACCLPTGGCVDTYLACCNEMGGIPQGAGTNCANTVCPTPVCRPIPGAARCSSTICPQPGQECLPRCVQVEPGTNFVIDIIDCDCVSPNDCHIEVDPVTHTFFCVGSCPLQGQECRTTVTTLADGTQQVCCECVDGGPPMACCNLDSGECLDLAPGSTQCPPGYSLVPGPCGDLQACCLPDGTCLDTFLACCTELNGMPQGAGTTCENAPCSPPECAPVPGTPFCSSTTCPTAGQECLPHCVKVEAGTTFVLEVVDCNCVSPNECHIEVDAANNYVCVGGCPSADLVCTSRITDNGDGTQTVCCDCVPAIGGICPIAPLQGADRCVDIQSQCQASDPSAFCAPSIVIGDPAVGLVVEQCSCFHIGDCGAIEILDDTIIQCAGECLTGTPCVIFANGVPQQPGPVNVAQFPPGTQFRCGCP